MSAESKNIRVNATTFRQLQEIAAREGKPLDDVADETIQNGLKADFEKRLLDLAEYGRRQAEKTHPGLTEQDIVDIVHKRRELNRS